MSMQLIDTHTHLDFPEFDADRSQVLQTCQARGVERLVLLGVTRDNWQRLWQMAETDRRLYAAIGLHPVYLDEHDDSALALMRQWLLRLQGHAKLCAVGEYGLDYFLQSLDKDRQQRLFEAQLAMACEFELPSLLHVRRAHAATLATLKRFRPRRSGIVHAFSGSYEEAREYIKLGFKLGIGGAATWPQANRLRRVLAQLPLEALVLETDAPDMAPAMYPRQRNSPEYLPQICAVLAPIIGITPEALAQASTANACELFGWALPDSGQV